MNTALASSRVVIVVALSINSHELSLLILNCVGGFNLKYPS